MQHFNSLEELVNAKAQEQHENNLYCGGCFTDNPQAAQADGFEVMPTDENEKWMGEARISKLSTELDWASKQTRRVTHSFELKEYNLPAPAIMIKNFGYVVL